MRMLVHLGYFVQDGGGSRHPSCYWVAPLSRLLLKENPFNARSLTFATVHQHLVDPWRQMSAWLRTSSKIDAAPNAFAFAHEGKKVYEVCSQDPQYSQLFSEGMAGDSWLFSRALVAKCRDAFEGLTSLVDVGGGTGNNSKVIVEAFPGIRCTVFDLPHVVSEPNQTHTNLDYKAGNMFTDDLPHADAILFKWVLCDWPDEPVLKMLKQCKKALTKNGVKGKLMIADHVLGHESCNDSRSMGTSLVVDMLFMSFLEGCLRTEKQWAKLFSDAGFNNYKITPVGGLRVLIEVYP
ncbi:unnamed protein product [Linum tenue]|uniref:O-methyltransferase C-terminal domain-containing protein n=1 Tax=Linum tenue TaxID=586396 RepID=A0AAV0GUV9_9ROSI|nr:unnamed protein product [Linum tenue]